MLKDWWKSEKCSVTKYAIVVSIALSAAIVTTNVFSQDMRKSNMTVICGERTQVYESLVADNFSPFLLGQETDIIFNEIWVEYSGRTAIHLKTSIKDNISCVTGTSQNVAIQVEKGVDL